MLIFLDSNCGIKFDIVYDVNIFFVDLYLFVVKVGIDFVIVLMCVKFSNRVVEC